MKTPPAERPIDSRDSIFPDDEERAPGRIFFRPEMVTLFEPRDLLPDPGIFRIGFGHFFPDCHGPGIVVFRGRVISSVLIELQRRFGNGIPPIIQGPAHCAQILQAKLRANQPVPRPVVMGSQFQLTSSQVDRAIVILFIQRLPKFGAQRLFLV